MNANFLNVLRSPLRARQPWKAVWIIVSILHGPLRLIFVLLYFIPPRFRPHPQWTYRQAVGNSLLKFWFSFASTVQLRTTKSLEPGSEKECFIVMKPEPPDSYLGVARDKMIKPAAVGGMWYPKPYAADTDSSKKIILHFHGGAYVLGGVRPMECGKAPAMLAKAIQGLVLCPQYRLSSEPNGRFPAALQDSITSYRYLLSLGIPSSKIVISGDSAGGNLALALLRYLSEHSKSLPQVSALLLWSPWLDLAADPNAINRHRNEKSDYLTPKLLKWGLRSYQPSFLEATHAYLSPINNPFTTEVPILLQHGAAEVLVDEQKAFCLQMQKLPGNRIERFESANAPHNIFLDGQILGFMDESEKAVRYARKFLLNNA
ncbi:MAG: hypothetical protein L6R39_002167 [Caloplaca ligustica]|nr:MAG: hypothetical protein L6R39_002167 [Caloplaca ligustica]